MPNKEKQFEFAETLGDFPHVRDDAPSEIAYCIHVFMLHHTDDRLDIIQKAKVETQVFEHTKSYVGSPPLPKNADRYQTLTDFVKPRTKPTTSVAKYMNPDTQQFHLFFAAFFSAYVNEIYLYRSAKNVKDLVKKLNSNKKIRPSLAVTILELPTIAPDNDYQGTEQLDAIMSNYIKEGPVRNETVKAFINFLKYIGLQLSVSMLHNKKPMNFRTISEIVALSLSPFGYQMPPAILHDIHAYADKQLRAIKKNKGTLSGGKGSAKNITGRKLKEADRISRNMPPPITHGKKKPAKNTNDSTGSTSPKANSKKTNSKKATPKKTNSKAKSGTNSKKSDLVASITDSNDSEESMDAEFSDDESST